MTETSPALIQPSGTEGLPTTNCKGFAPIKHQSVGFPLPNTELRIYDKESGKDVSVPNQWGSVLVKGPQVMKGYFNDEKATKEVSISVSSSTYCKVLSCDGWLTTGDVGYVDEEGYVYIVDREKDVIRSKGSVPISPSELERIIQQHPAVCDVVVVPSYNAQKEEVKKKKGYH